MEKERKIRTLNLVALIVAVLGLTVAFAALSKTLTINGTASVDAANWDVRLDNVKLSAKSGSASEIKTPKISSDGSQIQDINVSLTKPGDVIKYTFDIVNNGTIDAKLDLLNGVYKNNFSVAQMSEYLDGNQSAMDYNAFLTASFPVCDWDGDGSTTNEERTKCSNNLSMEANLDNFLSFITDGTTVVLPANQKVENLSIDIQYLSTASELPKGDVEINLEVKLIFEQN